MATRGLVQLGFGAMAALARRNSSANLEVTTPPEPL